ncbi:hypothetical protein KBZ12_15535 [Cyanobium sp. Cruz CV13-4-11]|uniref:hypothetical protein n=1 Tax=unclassified Cyanobium TaxID=2627006 RepID=UPI0020CCFE6C|nr:MULTISPECIES: hypothetical protein [unclassified Cyanobium]MCP9901972.1 hypothetical protein [Cyanobium sp. Cruz CV11-17]MCP9920862.1 hypothetical protein [Cyanobium sp. Cruz CV13-4-11]
MSASDLEPFLPDWIEAAAEEARSVALGMLRERGRGAVLVGVARVDAALEALLKAALAPPRGSESLFHTDRPLGSFGAKIALAARLGLIDGAVEQSLHNLRRVRNAFAHSTSEVQLADPPYRDRLRESVALARRNVLWEPMQLILQKHMAERGEASQLENDPGLADFVLLITILVAFLETGASTVRPLQPSLTMTLETGITQRAGLTQ